MKKKPLDGTIVQEDKIIKAIQAQLETYHRSALMLDTLKKTTEHFVVMLNSCQDHSDFKLEEEGEFYLFLKGIPRKELLECSFCQKMAQDTFVSKEGNRICDACFIKTITKVDS